ncbi:MAG: MopE-related protein [Bacteroidota bacterium]
MKKLLIPLLLLLLVPAVYAQTALSFVKASSQYVTVPHNASINLASPCTIEALVNYTGQNCTLVDKGDYDFLVSLNPNTNQNKLGYFDKTAGTWLYSTGTVPQGTKTHVAVVFSGGNVTFYINGVASGGGSAPVSQDNLPMNIGRQQPSACQCNWFNGTMDELRIWNVARTQAQLAANMNGAVPTNSSGLAAYYKFDEGSGTTTADATGHGNNGTLINGPTFVSNDVCGSRTFNYTGGVQDYVVPAGINSITLGVTGADGGDVAAGFTPLGGSGGLINASFPVMSGDNIRVIVGEAGKNTLLAGGGGGTGVINCGNPANCATGTLLLVAGGGGGAFSSSPGGGAVAITGSGAAGLDGVGGGGGGGVNGGGSGHNGAQASKTSISAGGYGAGASDGGKGFGGGGGIQFPPGGGGGGGGYTGGNGSALYGSGGSNYVDASALPGFTNAAGVDGGSGGTVTNGVVFLSFTCPNPCDVFAGNRAYVNGAVSGSGSGGSWATAFKTLQEAITAANTCPGITQIWVAQGTYNPDEGGSFADNDPNAAFIMKNGLAIYGGFAGIEANLTDRNITGNETILSGANSNASHVVVSVNDDGTAALDGFTIRGGNAGGSQESIVEGVTINFVRGGGVYIYGGSPQIKNCTIKSNSALAMGGGMYAENSNATIESCNFTQNSSANLPAGGLGIQYGTPLINNCSFSNNTAATKGGGIYTLYSNAVISNCSFNGNNASFGSGIANELGDPTITKCNFTNSTANGGGGGIYNITSNAVISGCSFTSCASNVGGGGIYNISSNPTITNSVFRANFGGTHGGAIGNSGSSPVITNCTFSENFTYNFGGAISTPGGTATIKNCIFWGNKKGYPTPASNIAGSDIEGSNNVTYSLTQANSSYAAGVGIINNVDPLFASSTDLHLQAGSPAINSGTNTGAPATDIEGSTRPLTVSNPADMGAYEVDLCAAFSNSRAYVNSTVASSGAGGSWATAFKTLQEALTATNTCPGITQIWVAQGTYYPDEGGSFVNNDPNASFIMKNGVAIYGGFPNTGNPGMADRNWTANQTILNGDIGTVGNNSDNSYHVVNNRNNLLNGTAVLDGFTIAGGNSSIASSWGGGMLNFSSSPSLSNIIFSGNSAEFGGGMFNHDASPSLSNVIFSGNSATNLGGGIFNENRSSPSLSNVTFSGNSATTNGGGMFTSGTSPSLTNCSFLGNVANGNGGGMYNTFSSPILTNCTFSGNQANVGGAMCNINNSSPSLKNCILWGNSSEVGNLTNSNPTYTNTIAKGLVAGGFQGTEDPLFVNQPPVGLGTTGDLHLQAGSPAINAGTNTGAPTTDIEGTVRPLTALNPADIGAYEYVAPLGSTTAVLSVNGTSIICRGNSANLKVTVTGGTAPYTVVYSDGTNNFTLHSYASGANIPVTPTATTTYSLVSVTDANLIAGTGNSGTPTITVKELPLPKVATYYNGDNNVQSVDVCTGSTTVTLTTQDTYSPDLHITYPEDIYFNTGYAAFGPRTTVSPLSGDIVYIPDGTGSYLGCNSYTPGSLNGKIALINRGACNFQNKVLNAQLAGAIAVIVANNNPNEGIVNMSGNFAITIPSVFISYEDGIKIKSWLSNGIVTANTEPAYTSYLWSTGATTPTITVSPDATATYFVTVTNAAGCTATSGIFTVNVLAPQTWYLDADGDGYYAGSLESCTNPGIGYTTTAGLPGDCNDDPAAGGAAVNPGATEICDGIDNNCNGSIDEGFTNTDGDGMADCVDPDDDNDGVLDADDCAPLDATRWQTGNFYTDADGDGYGTDGAVPLCYGLTTPSGYSTVDGDCNDNLAAGGAAVSPGATEICDGVDNNCNGQTDEGFTNTDGDNMADCVDPDDDNDGVLDADDCAPLDITKWRTGNFYTDGDSDGYGTGTAVSLCYGANTPIGNSTVGGDCNDANDAINPGAVEICGDGIDNNCNGSVDEGCGVCPLPQGTWKNNTDSWPASALPMMLGTISYTKAQLLVILKTPVGSGNKSDASLILGHQLIAAKLNIANGATASQTVLNAIAAADAAIAGNTIPMGIRTNTALGKVMTSLATTLDQYNNGLLNAGCYTAPAIAQINIIETGTISDRPTAQNFPNPFSSVTTIRYTLVADGPVSLLVYNEWGQKLALLANGRQLAGTHQVTFNAAKLGAGIYRYSLQTVDAKGKAIVLSGKMVMTR